MPNLLEKSKRKREEVLMLGPAKTHGNEVEGKTLQAHLYSPAAARSMVGALIVEKKNCLTQFLGHA